MRRIAVLGTAANESNVELVAAWQASGLDCALVDPRQIRGRGEFDYDVGVARLDVLPTLDGIEPGLLDVLLLERRGKRVHNTARALLATHDKLRTAAALAHCGSAPANGAPPAGGAGNTSPGACRIEAALRELRP
jgi:hypothetical protein